jgi:CubicO group peptidase (beta-lactamase class C family)
MRPFRLAILLVILHLSGVLHAQNLYFPPLTGTTWETTTPTSLGWCTDKLDSLKQFLERSNTKGFIILKDGRLAIEWYFGSFTRDSLWYWASAGKTLTGFAVGIAQQEGLLKLKDTTSKYLGLGWTSLTRQQEDKITVRHQLSMTTGLDDGVTNSDCTNPECLVYKADAGTRWAYQNAPYTLLDKVIESASGLTLNNFIQTRIRAKIGMGGLFVKIGYNNIHLSNTRSLARFGLLLLNKGVWQATPILTDTSFFRQMTNSSQSLNMAYGYLTWLNGKSSYMVPGLQRVFNGSLTPTAPTDMFSALGKNGQIIHIVPSQKMVVVRVGDAPDNAAVPILFPIEMWQKLNQVLCNRTSVQRTFYTEGVILSPNPASDILHLTYPQNLTPQSIQVFSTNGQLIFTEKNTFHTVPIHHLKSGNYFLKIQFSNGMTALKKIAKE